MATGYTKLFASIVNSTIWRAPDHVRLTWITMLAMADRHGVVEASVPGLADAARVTVDECVQALAHLAGPDEWSRTKEREGRRIEAVPGGWHLINHGLYRDRMAADVVRQQVAERVARYRARKAAEAASGNVDVTPVTPSSSSSSSSFHPPTPPPPPTEEDQIPPRLRGGGRTNSKDTLDRLLAFFGRRWTEKYERPFVPVKHARRLIADLLHARPDGFPPQLHVPAILVAIESYLDDGDAYVARAEHALGLFAAQPTRWFPAADDARVLDWAGRIGTGKGASESHQAHDVDRGGAKTTADGGGNAETKRAAP